MRKFLAILFLGIYLFNLVGYSLFYNYFIARSNKEIIQQIDNNNFAENQFIEIKTPVHLPYYTNNNEYKRVDGEIEFNGVHYNYVKQKVYNDTLYLLCIPNLDKTQLYKDKSSYANQANDLPSNDKDNTATKKNGFSNEYVGEFFQYNITVPVAVLQGSYQNQSYNFSHGFCNMQGQPPEMGS